MPTLLIVRPENRLAADCAQCRAAGWNALPFPPLHIEPLPEALTALAVAVSQSDALFWVSPTSVETAAPYLSGSLKNKTNVCVGMQTAAELRRHGFTHIFAPEHGSDSEAVLALPVWHTLPPHARITVVRGQGGRALLANTLRQQGFSVQFAEIYRRVAQKLDWQIFQAALPDAVWVTSSELAAELFRQAPPALAQILQSLLYFTQHKRIAENLRTHGANRIHVVAQLSDVFPFQ